MSENCTGCYVVGNFSRFSDKIPPKTSGRSSHWGTFVCKASNPLGQETAEITLTGADADADADVDDITSAGEATAVMLIMAMIFDQNRFQVLERKQVSCVPDPPPSLFPTSFKSSFSSLSFTSSPSPSYSSFRHSPLSPSALLILRFISTFSMEQISIIRENVILLEVYLCSL